MWLAETSPVIFFFLTLSEGSNSFLLGLCGGERRLAWVYGGWGLQGFGGRWACGGSGSGEGEGRVEKRGT